jgi:hypothetical protein
MGKSGLDRWSRHVLRLEPDPTGAQYQEGASSDGKTSSRIDPRKEEEGVMYEGCLRSEFKRNQGVTVPWVKEGVLLKGGQSFCGQKPLTVGLEMNEKWPSSERHEVITGPKHGRISITKYQEVTRGKLATLKWLLHQVTRLQSSHKKGGFEGLRV